MIFAHFDRIVWRGDQQTQTFFSRTHPLRGGTAFSIAVTQALSNIPVRSAYKRNTEPAERAGDGRIKRGICRRQRRGPEIPRLQ